MKLSKIASKLDFEFFGNDREIENIRFFDIANENDIAFVKSKNEYFSTKAKTLIMQSKLFFEINDSNSNNEEKSFICTFESLEEISISIAEILKPSEKNEFQIENGAFIEKGSVIGENVIIETGATIYKNATIGNGCYISSGAKIGCPAFYNYTTFFGERKIFNGKGKVFLGKNCFVGTNTIIERGTFGDTIIDSNTKIGHQVAIGHDSKIGSNTKIVTQSAVAGGAKIGKNVEIYAQCGVNENSNIGDNVIAFAQSGIHGNVKENSIISGPFGKKNSEELAFQMRARAFFKRK